MLDLVTSTTGTGSATSTGEWEETYRRCVEGCRQTHTVYAFGRSVRGRGWDACMKGCDNVAIAAARQEGVLPTVYKQILPRMREAIERQAFTAAAAPTGATTAKMNEIACINICRKKYTGPQQTMCIRNCKAAPVTPSLRIFPSIITRKTFVPLIPSTHLAPVFTKDAPLLPAIDTDTDIVDVIQPTMRVPGPPAPGVPVYISPKPSLFSRIPTWGWIAGAGALTLLLTRK